MKHHVVSFAELADWVDRRLGEDARLRVEAHLAEGCSDCRRDVAWLQRIIGAAKTDDSIGPPAEVVDQAKALFRERLGHVAPIRCRARWMGVPVFARAAAAVLPLVLTVVLVASQTPTLLHGGATLTAAEGVVERLADGEAEWRELAEGWRLSEGDSVRVLTKTAVLTLFDGSTLEAQSGADLTITTLRMGLFGRSHRVKLTQHAGSIDYSVAPLGSPFSSFEAQAPTVRVSVRGTRFVLTVEEEGETRVTVLQGRVWLVNAVESAILEERGVALVRRDAAVIRLPTLLPTRTPVAILPATPNTASAPIATASPTELLQSSGTGAPGRPTGSAVSATGARDVAPPTASATETLRATARVSTAIGVTPTRSAFHTPGLPATPQPDRKQFAGIVGAFPPSLVGVWQIGGREFLATRETSILGKPTAGRGAVVVYHVPRTASGLRSAALTLRIDLRPSVSSATAAPSATRPADDNDMRTPFAADTAPAPRTPEVRHTVGPLPTPPPVATPPVILPGPIRTPRLPPVPRRTPASQPTDTASPPAIEVAPSENGPTPMLTPERTLTAAIPVTISRTTHYGA